MTDRLTPRAEKLRPIGDDDQKS